VKAEAVVYVKDVARMCAFYEHCAGMTIVETGERYAVLESDAWTLSLVAVPETIAATIELAVPPRRREAAAIKLAFAVASIDAARPIAAGLGGEVDRAETTWEFRGLRRVNASDPEGNVFGLLESSAPA
jgi:predicted enzyme related to lactoylglutathione lyase